MTAHGSLDITIEAIKRGAFYYLEKPFTFEQVLQLAFADSLRKTALIEDFLTPPEPKQAKQK